MNQPKRQNIEMNILSFFFNDTATTEMITAVLQKLTKGHRESLALTA